jgi:hypothetical protein
MSAAATSGCRQKTISTGYKSTKWGGAQRGCVALRAAMSGTPHGISLNAGDRPARMSQKKLFAPSG